MKLSHSLPVLLLYVAALIVLAGILWLLIRLGIMEE